VGRDEGALELGGTKLRTLLAMLPLNANEVVAIDRLMTRSRARRRRSGPARASVRVHGGTAA